MLENDTEVKFLHFYAKLMLYASFIVIVVCFSVLVQYMFYESVDIDPMLRMPDELRAQITQPRQKER